MRKCLWVILLCCLGFCFSAGISPASEGEKATEAAKIVNKIVIINEYEEVSPIYLLPPPALP